MAYYDFMPFSSAHGGHEVIWYAPLNAAETFGPGELVGVNDDGELIEFPRDDSTAVLGDIDSGHLWGVSAQSGNTTGAATGGTTIGDNFANTSYPVAAADGFPNAGDLVGYYPADQGTLFITRNIVADAANTTLVAPAFALVGEVVTMENDGEATHGRWVLVQDVAGTEGTDCLAVIQQVLDANGNRVAAGATGTFVVFSLHTTVGV